MLPEKGTPITPLHFHSKKERRMYAFFNFYIYYIYIYIYYIYKNKIKALYTSNFSTGNEGVLR